MAVTAIAVKQAGELSGRLSETPHEGFVPMFNCCTGAFYPLCQILGDVEAAGVSVKFRVKRLTVPSMEFAFSARNLLLRPKARRASEEDG